MLDPDPKPDPDGKHNEEYDEKDSSYMADCDLEDPLPYGAVFIHEICDKDGMNMGENDEGSIMASFEDSLLHRADFIHELCDEENEDVTLPHKVCLDSQNNSFEMHTIDEDDEIVEEEHGFIYANDLKKNVGKEEENIVVSDLIFEDYSMVEAQKIDRNLLDGVENTNVGTLFMKENFSLHFL